MEEVNQAMPLFGAHLLSVMVFVPLLGSLFLLLPYFSAGSYRGTKRATGFCLGVTGLTFLISLIMLSEHNSSFAGMQFRELHSWIPTFGISYNIGVDGISIFLVLLTTLLMPLIVLSSHSVKRNLRGYLASMLVLETAMLGTLLSLDVFLFYVFGS